MTHEENTSRAGKVARIHAADAGTPRPWTLLLPAVLLAAVAVLVGVDVTADARQGGSRAHLAVELVMMVVALGGAVALWGQLLALRLRARTLHQDLARAEADLARFRADSEHHLRGLAEAIDRQFDRWSLSAAEREVALLLLKGLTHKDVASVRETSERTVRQQALAVYRKAGLAGRAELAAFFLEDLLTPAAPGRTPSPARPADGSTG